MSKWIRSRKGWWLVPIVLIVAIGIGGGWMLYNGQGKPPALDPDSVPGLPPLVPKCGDGVRNFPTEECDGADLTGCISGQACTDSCECVWEVTAPGCGNNQLDPGEQCDGSSGACAPGMFCGPGICQCLPIVELPACGNGVKDAGEGCDPPGEFCGTSSGFINRYCSFECQCELETTLCGNGLLEPSEECDPSSGTYCRASETCDPGYCQCVEVPVEAGPQLEPKPLGDEPASSEHPPNPCIEAARVEVLPVYDCRFVGGEIYEWYEGTRCYDANGAMTYDEPSGGPFTGPWQGGCPQGGGGDGGDGGSCDSRTGLGC